MNEKRKEILRARDEISALTDKIRALCEVLGVAATGEMPVQSEALQHYSEVIADLADEIDGVIEDLEDDPIGEEEE